VISAPSRQNLEYEGGREAMRILQSTLGGVVVSVLWASVPVLAHHNFAAEFDADKPVTLKGTVTRMDWINPHAWIYLDVKEADGTATAWKVECGAPNALVRRGFTKASVPPGTEIVVQGFRAKDGSNTSNGRDITLADGRKLFVGSSGTGAPDGR
jgi:hypothetical protein